ERGLGREMLEDQRLGNLRRLRDLLGRGAREPLAREQGQRRIDDAIAAGLAVQAKPRDWRNSHDAVCPQAKKVPGGAESEWSLTRRQASFVRGEPCSTRIAARRGCVCSYIRPGLRVSVLDQLLGGSHESARVELDRSGLVRAPGRRAAPALRRYLQQ